MRINSTDATSNISVNTGPSAEKSNQPEVTTPTNSSGIGDEKTVHYSEYEKRELPISEKAVLQAVEKANKAVSMAGRTFEYSIHEKTKEIMIKVIDSDTKEVIREIPPEKTLDMVASMMEMAGLLVDERR